jgi:phosphoribosylformylglycinamidine synthase
VVGCVGLVQDVRHVPSAWREGDAVFLAGAPELALDGSEHQSLYAELAGRPAPLDLHAEARLIAFVHRAAPLCSLVHDAAEGGLAVCLAEAAIVAGLGVDAQLDEDTRTLFGEGGGQAVLAADASRGDDVAALSRELDVPLRQIGTVTGDAVLGVPVESLREAWQS